MTESSNTTLPVNKSQTPATITELFHYTFPTESVTQHRVRVIKVNDEVYFGFAKYFLPPNSNTFIPSRKQYYFKIQEAKEFDKGLVRLGAYLSTVKKNGLTNAGADSSSSSVRAAGPTTTTVYNGHDGGDSSKHTQRSSTVEVTEYTAAAALHSALAAGPKMPHQAPIPKVRFFVRPANMLRTTGKFPPINTSPTIGIPCPTCPSSPTASEPTKRGRGRPRKSCSGKKLCSASPTATTEKSSIDCEQKAAGEEGASAAKRRNADTDDLVDLDFDEFAAADPTIPRPIRSDSRAASLADTVLLDGDDRC